MEELDTGWQVIVGSKPLLLIAGHNFEQGRQGMIKYAEWGSGDIVRKFAEKFGCFAIVSTKKQMDPNWYVESPFREKIREIIKKHKIKIVVDIHGSGMQNSELIFLRGNRLFIEKNGEIFAGLTVRRFVENEQLTLAEEFDLKLPIVEVEIREDGRIPTIDSDNYTLANGNLSKILGKLLTDYFK